MCVLFQIWPLGICILALPNRKCSLSICWPFPMLLRLALVSSLSLDLSMLKNALPCMGNIFTYAPKLIDSYIRFSQGHTWQSPSSFWCSAISYQKVRCHSLLHRFFWTLPFTWCDFAIPYSPGAKGEKSKCSLFRYIPLQNVFLDFLSFMAWLMFSRVLFHEVLFRTLEREMYWFAKTAITTGWQHKFISQF